MKRKRGWAIVAILVFTAFLANCSFFMQRPPSDYEPMEKVDCTDSYIVPTSDLLQSVSSVLLGLLLSSVGGNDNISTQGYIYLGTGAVYGCAAIYGYLTASKCRRARRKHEAAFVNMRRLLATAQVSEQPRLLLPPPADVKKSSGDGPWDPKRAKTILKRHRIEVRECVQRQIRTDPGVKGKLTVILTVASDGKVVAVDITAPEFANTLVAECLDKLMRGIQFPPFDGQPQKLPFWLEVK